MTRGIYTSALGMTTQMSKLDVISNNIANARTSAFKNDKVVTRSFSEELMYRLDDRSDKGPTAIGKVSSGVLIDEILTNFSNGTITNTNAPLDVAIMGSGFFAVRVTEKNGNVAERYTRCGEFTRGNDGTLLTRTGEQVLGENGPIVVNGAVSIDESGNVYSDGQRVDRFKLVDFQDLKSLRKIGNGFYGTTEATTSSPFSGKILQGALESSNVNTVNEMINMIATSRTYEVNSRVLSIHDALMARMVSDIARK